MKLLQKLCNSCSFVIETSPERLLLHNKMFNRNALVPSICIYFHLVVKYLLHSIMSHILGLTSKTVSSCTSHQLLWEVWVWSIAANQVSPFFWSHTDNTKEVAGKKVFFPSTCSVSYHVPTFNMHQKYLNTFGHRIRASKSMKRTKSGHIHCCTGLKHLSFQPNTHVFSIFQQTHRCNTTMGYCMACVRVRECQFKGIKIYYRPVSLRQDTDSMATDRCPSNQIFPEFRGKISSR